MKVIGWRVWIDSNRIYDSREHTWKDVLNDGIILMYTYKAGGYREGFSGHDHYFQAPHPEGVIYGCNDDSTEEIEIRYPGAVIKKGKWVPSEVMARIQKEAIEYKWQPLVTTRPTQRKTAL